MGKKQVTKAGILIALMLLFLPTIYSAEDFEAGISSESLTLCTTSTKTETLTLINTGDTVSEYALTTSNPSAIAVPDLFLLSPGERTEVDLFYNFPKAGQYSVSLDIATSGGLTKRISKSIQAQQCLNNNLLALNFNQTACPCLPMTYSFTVQNTGDTQETYVFGLDKFSEFATLSANPLVLSPGESQNVDLTLELGCSIAGDFLVNFFSNAQTSKITTKVPLLLNINACYDYTIATGNNLPNDEDKFEVPFTKQSNEYNICAGESTSVQVEIDNIGYIGNNFTYSLEGEGWASLYGSMVRLNGAERGYTFLDFNPQAEHIGTHKFVINGDSVIGGNKQQKVVTVNVEECHGLIVELPETEQLCNCVESDIPITLTNTGKNTASISLSVEGDDHFSLENKTASLNSFRSQTSDLIVTPNCDLTGVQTIKVTAQTEEAYAEDTMQVEFFPVEQCLQLDISSDRTITLEEETLIPITVTHTGVKESDYTVTLGNVDWITVDDSRFTLFPGETGSFTLLANPENVSSGLYTLEVNIQSENVVYQRHISLQVGKSSWDRTKEFISFNRYWFYTGIIILILLIALSFFIREKAKAWKIKRLIKTSGIKNGKKKKVEESSPNYWLILVFFLIIILTYLFSLTPAATIFTDFLTAYIWYILIGFLILLVIISLLNRMEEK